MRGARSVGAQVKTWDAGRILVAGAVLAALLAGILSMATRARASTPVSLAQIVGKAAPVIALPAERAGMRLPHTVTIGGRTGRPQVLVFFFTLCPRCLGEVGAVASGAQDKAFGNAQVVYIDAPGERADILDAYAARVGVSTPVLLDEGESAVRAYHVAYYPTIVLVDSQGVVRNVWYGDVSTSALQHAISALPDPLRNR